MNKSTVYIITHKEFSTKYPENYIPIQVGKLNTKKELPYISDDTGDNIAEKNSNYCELTGIYWILKNCELSDYVGIAHYRRYFKEFFLGNQILTNKKICEIMKRYDIILPKRFYFSITVWDNYFKGGEGKEKDLIKLKKIINDDYSDYNESFNKVMESYSASYCNMFVMKKEHFINYHNWLFEILKKMEGITDLSSYTKSEARIYGYLSELLLNVWVEKNGLKAKHQKLLKTDNKFRNNFRWNLKMIKNFLIGKVKEMRGNKYV